MSYQNISATISAADLQTIKDAFATILEKLPFLVTLSPAERQAAYKTGPDRVSFVINTLAAVQSNPDIFPASFDAAEFQKDVDLFTILTDLCTLASQLFSQLDDTRLAVGTETMGGARQAYRYIKEAAEKTPGLKPLTEQLGEQFKKTSKSKTPGKPTT